MAEETLAEKAVSHSPGPWTVDGNWIHGAPENAPLASCHSGSKEETSPTDPSFKRRIDLRSKEEVQANARLIAAAPTMRLELEAAADTFRDFSNVLREVGKDIMAAAAYVAERHIREYLEAIEKGEARS